MIENFQQCEANKIADKVQNKWQQVIKKNPKNPSFSLTLLQAFWKQILILSIFGAIAESLVGVSFYLMALIIQNLTNGVGEAADEYSMRSGLLYAMGYSFVIITMMVLRHNYQQYLAVIFVMVRTAITTIIYRKSLKLASRSISKISEGKIINAASSDLVVLDHGHFFLIHLIIQPFACCVHLGLMGSLIGIEIIYGFLIMIGMIFLQVVFAKCLNKARKVSTRRTDQRLKLLYDTVSGIRTIKTYGWENQIQVIISTLSQLMINQKRIIDNRQKQYQSLIWVTMLKSNAFSLLKNSGYISAGIIFFIKLYQNQILEAGPSFAILGVFNFMSTQVSLFMGYAITTIAEFKVTLDRTAKILLEEEKKHKEYRQIMNGQEIVHFKRIQYPGDQIQNHSLVECQAQNEIEYHNVDISWGQKLRKKDDDDEPQINQKLKRHKNNQSVVIPLNENKTIEDQSNGFDVILQNVNIKIKRGELIAVIGPVCSGKTTFLHSIMGQNYILGSQGYIRLNPDSKISYVQQDPFIIPDTVQNNITFGNRYEKDKFDHISKITCIDQDLEQLAMGKDTEIGQKGVNLSGGQKSRISLARAVYSEADIYLLDDPLSAVDPKVSSALMNDVIVSQLRGKTRILVTHQLHVLTKVDRILYLDQNQILFDGSLKEFEKTNFDLSEIAGVKNERKLTAGDIETVINQNIQQQESKIDEDQDLQKNQAQKQGKIENQQEKTAQIQNKKPTSQDKPQQKIKRAVTNLIVEQNKDTQQLNCKKFCIYFSYSCKCFTLPIIIILSIIPTLFFLYVSEWIRIVVRQTPDEQFQSYYRNMFLIIIFSYILAAVFRNFIVGLLTLYQTKKLHNQMVKKIVRGKVSFFDQNPVGRILNRFSKDISVGDVVLPTIFSWFFQVLFRVMAIFILICVAIPYITILIACVIFAVYIIRKKVLGVTRECMKLEGASRSPISTQLGSTISGIVTIRAYRQEKYFLQMFQKHVDTNAEAYVTFHLLSRAFGFYLDMISSFLIISFAFLSYAWRNQANVLLLALGIQIIADLLGNLQFGTRISSDIENYMVSINRCLEYARLEGQAQLITRAQQEEVSQRNQKEHRLWIKQGSIQFDDVVMRYRQDLEPALNELSFKIQSNMKVGIIGRTGSGKSSILQALFRMIELNAIGNLGAVYVDNIDISTLGLHKLRRSLSIIPQNPFIFQGTIRENLNPFATKEDEPKLWKALEDVKLAEFVEGLVKKLDTQCSDANSVFSTGQKQLLCLARAILNENKILVLDEATANIDMATDNIIQQTIREKFKNCTVLTIAHRLATIIDSDKIIVMKSGKMIETGHPFELLVNSIDDDEITSDSHLASMVKETKSHSKTLFNKAKDCYDSRYLRN